MRARTRYSLPLVAAMAAGTLIASVEAQPAPKPSTPPAPAATAPETATPRAAPETAVPAGIVARVNGVPIRAEAITDRMWREQGPVYADYSIRSHIVRMEAARRGITVTPQELKDHMVDYQAQFNAMPGRQPRDWDIFVARYGLPYIEERQKDELLSDKIGADEAAHTTLTDAEKARVLGDLERAAHRMHVRHVFAGSGPMYDNRSDADARARAEEARAKLQSGASWDDVAKAYSDDISTRLSGGDLGFFTRDQVVKPLEDAAFAASPSKDVLFVKVPDGYDVFQVLEREDRPPTEAQKQAALEEVLKRKQEIARQPGTWFPKVRKSYAIVTQMPYQTQAVRTAAASAR